MADKLKRKGECPSCKGPVVGAENSSVGYCVNCGAEVTGDKGEPSEAIERAVKKVLEEYGFEKKPAGARQGDDDLL